MPAVSPPAPASPAQPEPPVVERHAALNGAAVGLVAYPGPEEMFGVVLLAPDGAGMERRTQILARNHDRAVMATRMMDVFCSVIAVQRAFGLAGGA